MPKDGSSTIGSGDSQGQTGPRGEALANDDKVKLNTKGPKEAAAEQSMVSREKAETKTEVKTSSQVPPNWTIQFLRVQDRGGLRRSPCPGQHQHLIGVLQDSHPARGGGLSG
jgi:Ser-tRNA(Ala) deacylase AlaX